jgi:hypothetical protein
MSFADGLVNQRAGRNGWLDRIDEIVDWPAVVKLLDQAYASGEGRPPYPLLSYVKLLLQQWCLGGYMAKASRFGGLVRALIILVFLSISILPAASYAEQTTMTENSSEFQKAKPSEFQKAIADQKKLASELRDLETEKGTIQQQLKEETERLTEEDIDRLPPKKDLKTQIESGTRDLTRLNKQREEVNKIAHPDREYIEGLEARIYFAEQILEKK